jgi:hypothetical protein
MLRPTVTFNKFMGEKHRFMDLEDTLNPKAVFRVLEFYGFVV